MADYSFALPQLQFYKAPDWAAADEKAAKLQAANALVQEKQRAAGSANALRSSGGGRARTAAAEADPTEVRVGALDAAYAPFTRLVNRVQSPEDVAAFTAAVYNHPILGGEATKIKPVEQAVQDSQKEFMADPDRWRMMHGNLDGKTIYQLSQAATAPKIEKIDLGGAIKFIDMNPKSATFKQEMGDFTKTPVPRAALDQTSSVMEPPVNNLMPAPATAAAGARAAGPVQLAMLGGGNIPLLQMTRPMPSEGGVTTPTKVAARKKSVAEDGETPDTPINAGKVPDNYRRNAQGNLEFIPGSPADPEVIRAKQEATTMGTKTAEARVKAQTSLPQVIDNAKILEDGIAGLIGGSTIDAKGNVKYNKKALPHPGFEAAVGASLAKALPQWAVPYEGTDRAGFDERFKQVTSGAFMDAYNTLRGGGAITEKEGEKGTAALNRMSLKTSEKEFIEAANDFLGVVRRGVERTKEMSGKTGVAPQAQAAGFTVITPDNKVHTFPSQEAMDNFKRAAGL